MELVAGDRKQRGSHIFNTLPNEQAKLIFLIRGWDCESSLCWAAPSLPSVVFAWGNWSNSCLDVSVLVGRLTIKQRQNDFKQIKVICFLKPHLNTACLSCPKSVPPVKWRRSNYLSPRAEGPFQRLWGRLRCPSPTDKAHFISRLSVLFFPPALNSTSQS